MNVTELYNIYSEKHDDENNKVNNMVAACLLHIISQYFAKWANNFNLILSCQKTYPNLVYSDLLGKLLSVWDETWSLQIVRIHRGLGGKLDDTRRYNMAIVESYESFL